MERLLVVKLEVVEKGTQELGIAELKQSGSNVVQDAVKWMPLMDYKTTGRHNHHMQAIFNPTKSEVMCCMAGNLVDRQSSDGSRWHVPWVYRIRNYLEPVSLGPVANRDPLADVTHTDEPSFAMVQSMLNVAVTTYNNEMIEGGGKDPALVVPMACRRLLLRYVNEGGKETVKVGQFFSHGRGEEGDMLHKSPKLYVPPGGGLQTSPLKYVYNIQLEWVNKMYIESIHVDQFDKIVDNPKMAWNRIKIKGEIPWMTMHRMSFYHTGLPDALMLVDDKTKTNWLWIFYIAVGQKISFFRIQLREDGGINNTGGELEGQNAATLTFTNDDVCEFPQFTSICVKVCFGRVWMVVGGKKHGALFSCAMPQDAVLPTKLNASKGGPYVDGEWVQSQDVIPGTQDEWWKDQWVPAEKSYQLVRVPASFAL